MTWQDDEHETDDEHLEHGPDESDMSDEPAEVPCPYCKRQISEDAVQCPYCGCYVSEDVAPRQRPWWWVVAVVLLVALLVAFLLRWG